MMASTFRATPSSTTVTDGSMSTTSDAPRTRSVLPDGYAPFAGPDSTLTDEVRRRSVTKEGEHFLGEEAGGFADVAPEELDDEHGAAELDVAPDLLGDALGVAGD